MQPQYGNTVAVSLGGTNKHEDFLGKYRVRFYFYDMGALVNPRIPIENVLCSDLYADKIEAEVNGTSNST